MVGAPGEVAVTATPEAQEHIASLSGESQDTLWRNEVAPRALFAMMRYRPGDEAHRLGMPVLVSIAERDLETPRRMDLFEAGQRGSAEIDTRFCRTPDDRYGACQLLTSECY
jgi:hypothetical protein